LTIDEPSLVQELLDEFYHWEKGMTDPLWWNEPYWKKHSMDRYNQVYVDSLKKD